MRRSSKKPFTNSKRHSVTQKPSRVVATKKEDLIRCSLPEQYLAATLAIRKRKEPGFAAGRAEKKRARSSQNCLRLELERVTPERGTGIPRSWEKRDDYMAGHFEEADDNPKKPREAELICAVSDVLETTCSINQRLVRSSPSPFTYGQVFRSSRYPDGSSSVFFSLQRPVIVLRHYVYRLVKYLQVSRSVFIAALIYLDRVHANDSILAITDLNVHRLVTTALGLAIKYLEDESYRNSTVSRIGGVPTTAEMNVLERQFLRRLNWNCSISKDIYDLYERNVFKRYRAA